MQCKKLSKEEFVSLFIKDKDKRKKEKIKKVIQRTQELNSYSMANHHRILKRKGRR